MTPEELAVVEAAYRLAGLPPFSFYFGGVGELWVESTEYYPDIPNYRVIGLRWWVRRGQRFLPVPREDLCAGFNLETLAESGGSGPWLISFADVIRLYAQAALNQIRREHWLPK